MRKRFNDPNRIEFWASVLVEAALGSRIVSESLSNYEPPNWIESFISTHVPRRRRWFQRGILKQTLLTQLITVTYNSTVLPSSSMKLIECIRKIPSPFFVFVEKTIVNIIMFVVIISTTFLTIYYKLFLNIDLIPKMTHRSPDFLASLITLILYLLMFRTVICRTIYRNIITGNSIYFEIKSNIINRWVKKINLFKFCTFLLLNKLSSSVIQFSEARKEHNLRTK